MVPSSVDDAEASPIPPVWSHPEPSTAALRRPCRVRRSQGMRCCKRLSISPLRDWRCSQRHGCRPMGVAVVLPKMFSPGGSPNSGRAARYQDWSASKSRAGTVPGEYSRTSAERWLIHRVRRAKFGLSADTLWIDAMSRLDPWSKGLEALDIGINQHRARLVNTDEAGAFMFRAECR